MMDKEKKQLVFFGYGLCAILSFIGIRLWLRHGWILGDSVLIIAIASLLIITRCKVELLKTLYVNWMKVAHVIGSVVTAIILSCIFYLIFGFVGIFLRIIRRDLLNRQLEHTSQSYWIKRNPSLFEKNRYKQQF